MDIFARHPSLEAFAAVDPRGSDKGGDVLLDRAEILELLVEMPREQQDRVLKLTLAAAQRELARVAGHDRRPNGNRSDQEQAADDKPADRTAARQSISIDWSSFASHRGPLLATAIVRASI
jgi:hypothetical protein